MAGSAAMGVVTAYAALRVAGRVARTAGVAQEVWLLVGSLALALGLASVHLVSLLSRPLPDPLAYDLRWGAVAAALAVASGALLLFPSSKTSASGLLLLLTGGLAGGMIAGLDHAGLAAVGLDPLSTAAAAAAACVCLATLAGVSLAWMAHRMEEGPNHRQHWLRYAAALVAGFAIAGASLTSLAGTQRSPSLVPAVPPDHAVRVVPDVALPIVGGSFLLLLLVIGGAAIDRRVRRGRAETEALRRSEDRFRSLVQASSQIVWTTTRDGRMVGEQLSWAAFTGQRTEEYRDSGWFSAIHPEDRETTARLWEETIANQEPLEIEHRVQRHDGQYRDCVARVVPVLEEDGSVREWMGTHTDITDGARMKQEREVLAEAGRALSSSLESRETLGAVARLVVPHLADWCVVDLRSEDGALQRVVATHVDPQCAPLLQQMPPAVHGERGIGHVLRTEQSELIREVSDPLMEKIAADEESLRLLHEVGLVSLLSVPLTARGQILGVLTLALSESAERYDLRDLAFAEELARRAAIAIDNARLYAEAQRAVQNRDEILGVVSHDLRNPLNIVTMASELLLEEDLAEAQQRQQLEIIARSAKGMNRLIQDLLDVSRVEAGRLAIHPEPEDSEAILRETCELMRPLAEERHQRLTCEAAEPLPLVNVDRGRIEQVLSNLVGNGLKFTGEGGSIHVRASPSREGVQISVMDTGPGIPPDDLPRLFERHWQAEGTAHLGLGLGLAICRGIVEAHGGRIWAESELGRGTCIHFTLPATPPESVHDPGASDSRPMPGMAPPTRTPAV